MFRLVGVDPGARETGMVLRHQERLIAHTVVTRDPDDTACTPGDAYLALVIDNLRRLANLPVAWTDDETVATRYMTPLLVCVEQVNAPTGFNRGQRAPINPSGAIGAGVVLGAILGELMATWELEGKAAHVRVPPGRHGTGMPAGWWRREYPALIGKTEGPAMTGKLRHCRAAWDIAGAGLALVRPGK